MPSFDQEKGNSPTNGSLTTVEFSLTNHCQRTKVNISFSSWSQLLLGVPQGSPLRPLLFKIYLNGLLYPTLSTNMCSYIDDTTFHVCNSDLKDLSARLKQESLLAIGWFQANYRN